MTFRDDGAKALEWAASYLERVDELPVLAQVEPGEIRSRLPSSPPDTAESFDAVLRDLDEVILPGITHWQSPRFFAYFSVTGSEPGILAELLIAAMNAVGILWRSSPALTELEEVTLDWLAELLGLPHGWHGHIEDTASISTIAALAAARAARPGERAIVASEQAHSSVAKAARLLELDLRPAPVDDAFRLQPDGVDLEGACALVATVGTTSTTSVDPVPELARRCHEAGVWLHVDAAYAGASWVCPEFAWSREGVEHADSVVVNAHKWLLVPMDCSCLWTRRPDAFRHAFSLVPEYLRTPEEREVTTLSDYGPALGRRFRALKLWTVLRCFGRVGLQERIREAVRLAALFEEWVREEPGWELSAPRPFSAVCFRLQAHDAANDELVERVNRTGEIFIGPTKLRGRTVLRLAVGNARTTEADVRRAWDVLRREAASMGSDPVEGG
jgi:aromatic-L-amino-acid decarboxylase